MNDKDKPNDKPRMIEIKTFRNMINADTRMDGRSLRQNSIMAAPTEKPALRQNAQATATGVTFFLPISINDTKTKVGSEEMILSTNREVWLVGLSFMAN